MKTFRTLGPDGQQQQQLGWSIVPQGVNGVRFIWRLLGTPDQITSSFFTTSSIPVIPPVVPPVVAPTAPAVKRFRCPPVRLEMEAHSPLDMAEEGSLTTVSTSGRLTRRSRRKRSVVR